MLNTSLDPIRSQEYDEDARSALALATVQFADRPIRTAQWHPAVQFNISQRRRDGEVITANDFFSEQLAANKTHLAYATKTVHQDRKPGAYPRARVPFLDIA